MKCTNCGNEVPETANVCGYCGNRLRVAAPPPAPEVRQVKQASGGVPGWVWGCGGIALVVGLIAVIAVGVFIFRPASSSASGSGLILQDDFSDPGTADWTQAQEQNYSIYHSDGTYHIEVNVANGTYGASPEIQTGADVKIEARARVVDGGSGSSLGVTCRLSGRNYYLFEIKDDGKAAIGKYTESDGWETLADWRDVSSFRPGDWNVILASCRANELILYINGEKALYTYDSTLKEGGVGLMATTGNAPGLHVEFDDFSLWEY